VSAPRRVAWGASFVGVVEHENRNGVYVVHHPTWSYRDVDEETP